MPSTHLNRRASRFALLDPRRDEQIDLATMVKLLHQEHAMSDRFITHMLARNIRIGGSRQVQLRVDAFNAFNQGQINGRNTSINYNSPTDLTIRNSQTLADGTNDPARVLPRNAGFGAANGWTNSGINGNYQRVIQFQARFQF